MSRGPISGWVVRCSSVLIVAVIAALSASPALADNERSSAIAKMCQQDGFASLFQPDGTPFPTAGACTSYGARGGLYSSLRLEQRQCPTGFPADDSCLFVTGFGLLPLSFAASSEISFLGDVQLDQFSGPTIAADGTVDQLFAAFRPCSAFVSATARAFTSLAAVIEVKSSTITCT